MSGASGSWDSSGPNPFQVNCKPGWHPVIAFGVPVACLPNSFGDAISSPLGGAAGTPGGSGGDSGAGSCSPGWNPVQVLGQTVMCVPSQQTWASIGVHTLIAVLGGVLIIVGAIALLRE